MVNHIAPICVQSRNKISFECLCFLFFPFYFSSSSMRLNKRIEESIEIRLNTIDTNSL